AEPLVAGPARKREEVGEPGNARAVDRLLAGKAPRVIGARLDPADVVARQFIESEGPDRGTGRLQPFPVGPARDIGIENGVVIDDDHAVSGDRAIELEARDAKGDTVLEAGKRVLRRQSARAAMSQQFDAMTGGSHDGNAARTSPKTA